MTGGIKPHFRNSVTALLIGAALIWSHEPARAAGAGGESTASPAAKEEPAPVALEADRIDYDHDTGVVTASGDVQIFYDGRTLTADQVIYDPKADRVNAKGNLILRDTSGAVLYADAADMDAKLRNGLIQGAAAVLANGQARLAAVEARRHNGNLNVMSKAVFSPCHICADDPTPLWRIRARRVIHDESKHDIIYEDATFDLFGVPIGYLPYFSHPDPTVKQRSGFLTPTVQSSGNYGWAVKTPYHLVLAPNRDLTLTPFVMQDDNPILQGKYRALTETGGYTLDGSLGYSDFDGDDRLRGHLFGSGRFQLKNGWDYGFQSQITSDDAYMRRFDISDKDRLSSELFLENFRDRGFSSVSTLYFQSLRDNEPTGQIPIVLPQIEFQQSWDAPSAVGGAFTGKADTTYLRRNNGRDVARISGELGWERGFTHSSGLLFTTFASARTDLHQVSDDDDFDSLTARFLPRGGFDARYPMIHATVGATHILEPIAQVIIAPYGGNSSDIPDEDSTAVEFDEVNLFEYDRHPGLDRFEDGPRLNLGLRYEMISTGGVDFQAALGQVFRLRESDSFSKSSGLRGTTSDYVAGWSLSIAPNLSISNRFRIDENLHMARNEVSVSGSYGLFSGATTYIFLDDNPQENSFSDRSEISTHADLKLNDNWSITGHARRDLEEDRFVTAGGGLRYMNECIDVLMTVSRRFTDSKDAPGATSAGIIVKLRNLGD